MDITCFYTPDALSLNSDFDMFTIFQTFIKYRGTSYLSQILFDDGVISNIEQQQPGINQSEWMPVIINWYGSIQGSWVNISQARCLASRLAKINIGHVTCVYSRNLRTYELITCVKQKEKKFHICHI